MFKVNDIARIKIGKFSKSKFMIDDLSGDYVIVNNLIDKHSMWVTQITGKFKGEQWVLASSDLIECSNFEEILYRK